MRVLVEPVVFNLPDAVISELVCQLRLGQTVMKELPLPRPRRTGNLHLIEQRELHPRGILFLFVRQHRHQSAIHDRIPIIGMAAVAFVMLPETKHSSLIEED